jgi:hypothetical protein
MANELNVFFSRFESDSLVSEVKQMESSLQMFERVVAQQSDVLKLFRGCNTQKPRQNKWTCVKALC